LSKLANIAFRRPNGTALHAEKAFRALLIASFNNGRSTSGTAASCFPVAGLMTDDLLLADTFSPSIML
jgi:hypothetical protein